METKLNQNLVEKLKVYFPNVYEQFLAQSDFNDDRALAIIRDYERSYWRNGEDQVEFNSTLRKHNFKGLGSNVRKSIYEVGWVYCEELGVIVARVDYNRYTISELTLQCINETWAPIMSYETSFKNYTTVQKISDIISVFGIREIVLDEPKSMSDIVSEIYYLQNNLKINKN